MRSNVTRHFPLESCGLVAGLHRNNLLEAREIIPIHNILASSTQFMMSPEEQLIAFEKIEQSGWELLAIYHSHPAGPPYPSKTDLTQHYYPDALALIWSPVGKGWDCYAFEVNDGNFDEIGILLD
jgi:proteasome lid subunit RPN8/RPN11